MTTISWPCPHTTTGSNSNMMVLDPTTPFEIKEIREKWQLIDAVTLTCAAVRLGIEPKTLKVRRHRILATGSESKNFFPEPININGAYTMNTAVYSFNALRRAFDFDLIKNAEALRVQQDIIHSNNCILTDVQPCTLGYVTTFLDAKPWEVRSTWRGQRATNGFPPPLPLAANGKIAEMVYSLVEILEWYNRRKPN